LLKDGTLCIQTLSAGTPEQPYRLETFDGASFQPLSVPPPDPAPGSSLSTLFAAQNGDLWVSGDHGTACYHDQKWRTFTSTDRSTPESVVGFTELADGKIWCATADKVWAFDGRNWSAVRAGMDRINAFIGTRDGSLWVAAFSRARGLRMARKRACPEGESGRFMRTSVVVSGPEPPAG
jgi:ligand-binding sensor domain-containing protein